MCCLCPRAVRAGNRARSWLQHLAGQGPQCPFQRSGRCATWPTSSCQVLHLLQQAKQCLLLALVLGVLLLCRCTFSPDFKMLPPCGCSVHSRSLFVDARSVHTCTDTQKHVFPSCLYPPRHGPHHGAQTCELSVWWVTSVRLTTFWHEAVPKAPHPLLVFHVSLHKDLPPSISLHPRRRSH